MTGEWLIVKWVVVAMFLFYLALALVAFVRLDGRPKRRAQKVSLFMMALYSLAHIMREIFASVSALRAFYVVVGIALAGTIAALLRALVWQQGEGLTQS